MPYYTSTSRGLPNNLDAKRNHPIEITQGMDEEQKKWVIKFWCSNFWPKGQKYITDKQIKSKKML